MDKHLFCIFDKISEIYEPPFTEINRLTAIRRITDLMQTNPQSPYAKFPDNYELVYVGTYDELGGIILPCTPETVLKLEEVTQTENKE